ncbi:MAG: LysR family transcriptional regulator, partial [Rhodocyclaceae bacterium]|nr:LysR family transcriptional regulator [Rhodocyclaceae bacterium]
GEDVAVRPRLIQWFESRGLFPRIVGEFDDSALVQSFGQAGAGLFVAPTAIARDVRRQYGVKALGRIESVTEQLYAITTERRLTHPGVIAVVKATQQQVFGAAGGT